MMKKYQKEDSISYVLGAFPSIELIQSRPQVVEVVYQSSKYAHGMALTHLCEQHHLRLEVNDNVIDKLSDKENVFVIVVFKKYAMALSQGHHVVLIQPENLGNIGTIIRTIVGFGFRDLAIVRPAVDVFDPKAIRASMGALFHLNVQYFDSFKQYQNAFPNHAYYPFMLQSATFLDEMTFPKRPSSLIFGPEGNGLTEDYLTLGQSIKIRQDARIDSLNLPIAVSVATYEFTKQVK
jgi:RNA methyltransferase, TrmH family